MFVKIFIFIVKHLFVHFTLLNKTIDELFMEKFETLTCNIYAIAGTIIGLKCVSQSLPFSQLYFKIF